MKDNFPACLALTLKYEGGYVNHPRDPGGPTNLGVTIATLSHELGRKATVEEVRALTREAAGEIYRKKYWNLVDGDALPKGVDALLFDIAVNSGPGRALDWDRASRALAPPARVHALDARRRSFYRALAIFPVFGRGWMAREDDILKHSLAMAAGARPSAAPAPVSQTSASEPVGAPDAIEIRRATERISNMKGYRTYMAAGLVAAGGVVAQTDWLAFMVNPQAGLVAIGSATLMAVMRSITTSAPGALR